jgi:murein DD-endopeptidase MepM/ murein hydrolase activator NlpD
VAWGPSAGWGPWVMVLLSLSLSLVAPPGAAGRAAAEEPTALDGPTAVGGPTGDGATPRRAVRYVRPVGGAVVRPFAAAVTPYGPGHRGVDLALEPGGTVRAAAAGVVRHAGPVAGTVWVSVDHADGITTSYGPLTALQVRRGDLVDAGTELGRLAAGGHGPDDADVGLHWGARRGGIYLDPLTLLEPAPARPALVGVGGWRGSDLAVEPYEPWPGSRWGGLGVAPSPAATRPGFAVPPNPNHLVVLRGLGSSSEGLPFDPGDLGYDPRSVTAHSYAGPDPDAVGTATDPWRSQRPYGPEDTWRGVEAASAHLRDQLRARWAAQPGRAVDLVGYSMGGVVALHYLTHHHDPYDPTLPPIGHVVTLASPLLGSDVAAFGSDVRDHRGLAGAYRTLREGGVADGLPPLEAAAIEDLRPGSTVLDGLAEGWRTALAAGPAGALATGTRVLTVAGSRDQVVAARRAVLPPEPAGHEPHPDGPAHAHRVLPGGHGSVLATEALREVTWRFLAGEEVVDSPGHLATTLSREQGDALRITGGLLRLHDRLTVP